VIDKQDLQELASIMSSEAFLSLLEDEEIEEKEIIREGLDWKYAEISEQLEEARKKNDSCLIEKLRTKQKELSRKMDDI
jgi:uncharacterized membrane protein (DUF106 family)